MLRLALVLLLVAPSASAQAPPDTAASVRWTAFALDLWAEAARAERQARVDFALGDSTGLLALRPLPPAAQLWTLLALAQHDAAPYDEAAVVEASAATLGALLPTDALRQRIEERRRREGAALADTVGLGMGRRLALARLATAPDDDPAWSGSVPTGPGRWWPREGTEPEGAAVPGFRTWVLDRADRFRPPPPPAVGSPDFRAALAEVRESAANRTGEQRRTARFWAWRNGATEWARRAAALLAREGTPDPEAAAVLALLQVSLYDATVACWEAKYHYWLLRPSQAEPTITMPWGVSLPNFPAYPAGHACAAGAAEAVLTDAMPGAAEDVRAAAWEMAESRLWAGVHYRFDNEAGLALGRAIARYVLARADRLALPEDGS